MHTLYNHHGVCSVKNLLTTFWVLFAVWPFAMPLLFAGLLWYIKKFMRSDCITDLSEACCYIMKVAPEYNATNSNLLSMALYSDATFMIYRVFLTCEIVAM